MTFNQSVKEEIINTMKLPPCCKKAVISAFIRTLGELSLDQNGFGLILHFRITELAQLAEKYIVELYKLKIEKTINTQNITLRIYNCRQLLSDCGIIKTGKEIELIDGIINTFTEKECCAKSYLTALFLGSGMVRIPITELSDEVKGGYHMELSLVTLELALDTVNLFADYGFDAKLSYRKDKQLVYFKDSESISDLLAFYGASKAVMAMQNSIAARSIRAEANRTSNCITANIDKSINAAAKQITAIDNINQTIGLQNLSEALQETARLRKANPSANLEELTNLHRNVTKSGVNHRLRALIKLGGEHNDNT
ncbi:MAG: DNA-binding protein WhiA [Clostridia bacterium]